MSGDELQERVSDNGISSFLEREVVLNQFES